MPGARSGVSWIKSSLPIRGSLILVCLRPAYRSAATFPVPTPPQTLDSISIPTTPEDHLSDKDVFLNLSPLLVRLLNWWSEIRASLDR